MPIWRAGAAADWARADANELPLFSDYRHIYFVFIVAADVGLLKLLRGDSPQAVFIRFNTFFACSLVFVLS